jgi:hypothetical protein
MADEVTFRVNSNIDTNLTVRTNILLDLLDMLKDIKTANSYKTNPVKNILFQLEELNDKELPANIIYDHASIPTSRNNNWLHKLIITFAHVTADGKNTSTTLNIGVQDVLTAIGKFHDSFCEKYSVSEIKPSGDEWAKGAESNDKTRGEMDAIFEITYTTPVWKF